MFEKVNRYAIFINTKTFTDLKATEQQKSNNMMQYKKGMFIQGIPECGY